MTERDGMRPMKMTHQVTLQNPTIFGPVLMNGTWFGYGAAVLLILQQRLHLDQAGQITIWLPH